MAHAAPTGYVYLPLNTSGYTANGVYGVSNGSAVGYGYSSADASYHPLAWNLATGTSSRLDEAGLTNGYAQGATSGYAVGYANFYDAYSWNLSTGARTQLTSPSTALALGAGNGYAWGNTGSNANPAVWNLSSGARTTLAGDVFDGSAVSGVLGAKVVGWTHPYGTDSANYRAAVWDLSTGNRTQLAGVYSKATGASSGYAVGDAGTNPYDSLPAKWDLATGAKTALDATGLYSGYVNVNGAGNGVAFGKGYGDATNYGVHAMIWDIATNQRTDLQTAYMPANRVRSSIFGIDEQNGTMVGQDPNSVGDLFALVAVSATAPVIVAPGGLATVNGSYTQSGGIAQINGTLRFAGGGNTYTLTGGTLQGTGTIDGNLAVAGGTVAPGNSPGTLTITGNFAHSAGIYSVELASASLFDRLSVSGAASFTAGSLVVTTLSGFTPTIGQFFDVVSATGGITGIGNVSVPTGYTFTRSGNNGRLTFVGAVAVPEAGTGALLLFAGAMSGCFVRRYVADNHALV